MFEVYIASKVLVLLHIWASFLAYFLLDNFLFTVQLVIDLSLKLFILCSLTYGFSKLSQFFLIKFNKFYEKKLKLVPDLESKMHFAS